MSAVDATRRVSAHCVPPSSLLTAAILELDDRLRAVESPRDAAPAPEPLPKGWTIDGDGWASLDGEFRAYVDACGELALFAYGEDRPRIPGAVARALLARSQ